MGVIKVTGIRLYGYHGCLVEESQIGGNYIVNVELETDLSEPGKTDKLSTTIDYVKVNQIVEEEMEIRSDLIEHVCQRMLDRMAQQFPQLVRLQVEVIKVSPPINGNVDNVSVILEFRR